MISGVYIFYDNNKNPIYVGISNNIERRVKEHIRGRGGVSSFLGVQQIDLNMSLVSSFEIKIMNMEEARIFESDFIKKNNPMFNGKPKDNIYSQLINPLNWKVLADQLARHR